MTKTTNVDAFAKIAELTPEESQCIGRALFFRAKHLVTFLNNALGVDALYLFAYADSWILYGRPGEEVADKPFLFGTTRLEDLLKLVFRLEGFLHDG